MVKHAITAAAWATANTSLYHQPWTTDKQNRFFSLQAWGPISDNPKFSAKFLGRPLNVGFKSTHKAMGKAEPCLALLFPPDLANVSGCCRLVQPCNFVVVEAFDGYDPIDQKLVQAAKVKKGCANGSWYKHVWNEYCDVEAPSGYVQKDATGPVQKAVEEKKLFGDSKESTQTDMTSFFKKAPETFSEDDDDKDKGDEKSVDVVGGSNSSKAVPHPSPERPTIGGKTPQHLNTLQNCIEWKTSELVRERKEKKLHLKQKKSDKKHRKRLHEVHGSDYDSDDLPDVSSCSESEYDSDFLEECQKKGHKLWQESKKIYGFQDAPARSNSTGSVSSASGIYELCFVLVCYVCSHLLNLFM